MNPKAKLINIETLCAHGLPLDENVCGPCSKGRPNKARPKAELMQALRARRHKDGLREVTVWVPAHAVDKLRKYAARLVKS